jgi:hypothetical protein
MIARVLAAAAAAAALAIVPAATADGGQTGGGPQPANQPYAPHLPTLGYDTLGPPATGYNSEIDIDAARKFAYVGSITFGPGDGAVKAVDVSNPADPTLTDAEAPLCGAGCFGTWDVTVAGNILAASEQGEPASNPGVTLMDITNPANPVAISHIGSAEINSPFGSHTNYLWRDPASGRTWLFVSGLDLQSIAVFDVTNPAAPSKVADYTSIGGPVGYVHDSFVQENGGRVLSYQVGLIGFEILDITRVVRGGQIGPLTNADVVGFNYYTGTAFFPAVAFPAAPPVTRPMFAHYAEPTRSGRVTWVGDEAGCGEPAIVHSFDTTGLPLPPAKKPLRELGVIIENPDSGMCSGLINGDSFHSQLNEFRWKGHNFRIWRDELLIRGDYGRGVDVYDISNPANAGWVAKSRGLNQMVGDANVAAPSRDKSLENYPFVWRATYDGDRIYASDINQGIYVLDLVEGR